MSHDLKLPWSASPPTAEIHAIRDSAGRVVADVGYGDTHEKNEAVARYIMASANACACFSDKEVDRFSWWVPLIVEERDASRKRGDELAAQVQQLELAEEGAKEAFGAIIEKNHALRARLTQIEGTVAAQQGVIQEMCQQRGGLLAALKGCVEHMGYGTEQGRAAWYAANEAIAKRKEAP